MMKPQEELSSRINQFQDRYKSLRDITRQLNKDIEWCDELRVPRKHPIPVDDRPLHVKTAERLQDDAVAMCHLEMLDELEKKVESGSAEAASEILVLWGPEPQPEPEPRKPVEEMLELIREAVHNTLAVMVDLKVTGDSSAIFTVVHHESTVPELVEKIERKLLSSGKWHCHSLPLVEVNGDVTQSILDVFNKEKQRILDGKKPESVGKNGIEFYIRCEQSTCRKSGAMESVLSLNETNGYEIERMKSWSMSRTEKSYHANESAPVFRTAVALEDTAEERKARDAEELSPSLYSIFANRNLKKQFGIEDDATDIALLKGYITAKQLKLEGLGADDEESRDQLKRDIETAEGCLRGIVGDKPELEPEPTTQGSTDDDSTSQRND